MLPQQQPAGRLEAHDAPVENDVSQAEQGDEDGLDDGAVEPQHSRHHRERAQHPQVGRGHRIAARQLSRAAFPRRPAQETPVDQAVQVGAVGHAHRHAAQPLASVDRKQCLEHRVDAQQQREHRRDARVAVQQQDRKFGDIKPQKVRTAVAEEDEAGGEVEDEKAQDGADAGQGQHRHQRIADREGHIGQAAEHDHDAHRGQTVEAVDDVDGVGNTRHDEDGDGKGAEGHGHEGIEPGNVGALDQRVHEPARKRGRDHREEQAPTRALVLGEVFGDAGGKSGHRAQQEGAEPTALIGFAQGHQAHGRRNPDNNPNAAHAWLYYISRL